MNIAVFFGGESCEHDISIITGEQLIGNIDTTIHKIIPIYIDKEGQWLTGDTLLDMDNFISGLNKLEHCMLVPNDHCLYTKKRNKYKNKMKIDVAILCVHGRHCEDGTLSAILEMSKIPYTSASICGSSVCLDKCVFKYFCKGLGVKVIDGFDITDREFYLNRSELLSKVSNLGYPVILKPCRLGSSIGIEVAEHEDDLELKLSKCFSYDNRILIENYANIKKEVNIALFEYMGELIFSSTEEPIGSEKILSFDDKYSSSNGFEDIKRLMPADISQEELCIIKNMAEMVYKKLDLSGVIRCDFIIDTENNIFLNEINTIPGSMANYLFDKDKLNYSTLIDKLIDNAIHRKNYEDNFKKIYNTDVIKKGILGIKK